MDYVTVDEELVFTDTVRQRCIAVVVSDDTTPEFDEEFNLTLQTEDDLVMFGTSQLTVMIPANDCKSNKVRRECLTGFTMRCLCSCGLRC